MIDFPRYLAAKKSVDDRSINRFVWERLRVALAERKAQIEQGELIYIAHQLDFLGQNCSGRLISDPIDW